MELFTKDQSYDDIKILNQNREDSFKAVVLKKHV